MAARPSMRTPRVSSLATRATRSKLVQGIRRARALAESRRGSRAREHPRPAPGDGRRRSAERGPRARGSLALGFVASITAAHQLRSTVPALERSRSALLAGWTNHHALPNLARKEQERCHRGSLGEPETRRSSEPRRNAGLMGKAYGLKSRWRGKTTRFAKPRRRAPGASLRYARTRGRGGTRDR